MKNYYGEDNNLLQSQLYLLSGVFIRQFYIRFNKWDTAEAGINNIIETVLSLEETEILPDLSTVGGNETGERLYYVCGWALSTGSRQKQLPIARLSMTLISKRTDLSGSLPTKLVDDSQIFGKLVYANRPFYEFYAYMEKLCSLFLCTHNLVLYGNSIVQETK